MGGSGFSRLLTQHGEQPVPAAPGLDAAGASVKKKKSAEPSRGSWADQNRPEGQITKGEKKPLPNRLCYPELFKGRIGPKGEWLGGKVPKCKRCEGNLFPEENHECPGFIPKFPTEPKKRMVTFDDYDEPEEDFDDDHLAKAATREEL